MSLLQELLSHLLRDFNAEGKMIYSGGPYDLKDAEFLKFISSD